MAYGDTWMEQSYHSLHDLHLWSQAQSEFLQWKWFTTLLSVTVGIYFQKVVLGEAHKCIYLCTVALQVGLGHGIKCQKLVSNCILQAVGLNYKFIDLLI